VIGKGFVGTASTLSGGTQTRFSHRARHPRCGRDRPPL